MARTVKAIRDHPRRRGRLVIEIDDGAEFVVGSDAVADLSLHLGEELSPAAHRALEVANSRTSLLDRALNILAAHARSRRDLRLRLGRTRAPEADITWVMDRLESLGYLDDAAYARQLAHARIVGGGTSKRRVQTELFKRGVPRDTASAAIEATLAEVELDEYGAALAAARKRARSLQSVDESTRRRRLYAFLARRGYEPDVVSRVVREALTAPIAE